MFPEPELIGTYFHELFKIYPDHLKKKTEWKKNKKGKSTRSREKKRTKIESIADTSTLNVPPEVELSTNASNFAVFYTVRMAVLESSMKESCEIYLSSYRNSSSNFTNTDTDSDEEVDDENKDLLSLPRIPKIVGVGLRCAFELIRECRTSHPALCTKALGALLDVVQGQQPEGLKAEPAEVIEPLFKLLLDLTTSSEPDISAPNDGMHLTAIACSCLLSLVAVRGDTGKLLNAVATLLMCPKNLYLQNIQLPHAVAALQRSVHGVLLGKVVRPDWISLGVPKSSRLSSFKMNFSLGVNKVDNHKSMASDGQYLYLHSTRGLFKIGSGFGNTVKGFIYLHKSDFFPDKKGWLGFTQGNLYFKGLDNGELLSIDRETLNVVQVTKLDVEGVLFSDSENLGIITSAKDDGFVVRTVNPGGSPIFSVGELPLKLARKCVDVFGVASFDEDSNIHTLEIGCDEEVSDISAGKDFCLIRTASGKVLYCGKSASLGLKQASVSGIKPTKWSELSVVKTPKITQIATGHDGLHAVLVAEDGSVFFTGTARRGEDGDQNKVRRQTKAAKPKKITKIEPAVIVLAACNNGTTALITREGELHMFGKDTTHCDPSTGQVNDLKDVQITQVALGKAHTVVVSNKGHLYTFGINNKGQCGRDFVVQVKEATVVAMETTVEDEGGEEEEQEWEDAQEVMCAPGTHKWKHDLCMVCTVCRECTGYSISCLSSMRPDRNPGQECGCGEGDSGCAECGCCRICAKESVDNSELAILGPSGAGDIAGMMRLDLIFGGRHGARLQDHLQRRLEERKQRQRGKLSAKHSALKIKGGPNKFTPSVNISTPTAAKPPLPIRATVSANFIAEEGAGGSDVEREASRVSSLPPARVHLPSNSPVQQIACGLHHTVVMTQNGEVYTFGSNSYGQLGVGDIMIRGGPVQVKLSGPAIQIAAGSNHTVVLTGKGEVYTFGSYQKNQLGRGQTDIVSCTNQSSKRDTRRSVTDSLWYSIPGLVPHIGSRHGRRATWIGASGDQTFLKIDESLINSSNLKYSTLMGNKSCILLLPTQCDQAKAFKCLVINKRDGNCNSFCGNEQVDFVRSATCLDPLYNMLWSCHEDIDGAEITCYNIVCCETRMQIKSSILSPELSLPSVPGCLVTRSQAALHLLGVLDTLTAAQDKRLVVKPQGEEAEVVDGKVFVWEDYSSVTRFESHGGGWGYSGHSIEAIRFMADTDILLAGFGLFGGRGEYTGKVKLFDIGMDGGEQESDGEMLAETEEIPYECGLRQKYPMMFDEPISIQANRWYVAWARVNGPSSDCGSSGQGMVTTEDQVVFYFKSSKKSNNGTDVNAGQIPQLLYRVITTENQTCKRQIDLAEPVFILSKDFSRTVSVDCFKSLLALLQWSWNTFKSSFLETHGSAPLSLSYLTLVADMEHLVYISQASLRLLRTFVNEIYPARILQKKSVMESVRLAECVGDVRVLLHQILLDPLPSFRKKNQGTQSQFMKMGLDILHECHQTFVSCFHAFYPTPFLKWTALCNLLNSMNRNGESDRLISAVVAALCSPMVRLRSTFPILNSPDVPDYLLRKTLTPSDNSGVAMIPRMETHQYPVLVEQMSFKSQSEGNTVWQFREVLDKLLDIVSLTVQQALCLEKVTHKLNLVTNCCNLLAKIIAELSAQARGIDDDLEGACGRILHVTPSRFTRTNQSRTWNTGNGSPDAICFTVDKPGVVIAGVGVYGGVGTYDYELELLDDQSNSGNDASHAQRWNSLQLSRGSFGPEDLQADDIVELMFEYPIFIKDNVKYAIRLRNHGGRTSNGDGGISSVKGPDGVTFTFSTCSLNFNGTTPTRGQIPYILYFSNPQDSESQANSKTIMEMQARKTTLSLTGTVVNRCTELLALARERAEEVTSTDVLGNACLITTLLPIMLAHISPLAISDPRSGVQVLNLIQEILPHVSALNLLSCGMGQSMSSVDSNCHETINSTSSNHYAWVESDHPYKPATVSNYRVVFPETVKWMAIEFSSECGTIQPEDSLQLYIPTPRCNSSPTSINNDDAVPYWPVLHKFSNHPAQWPQSAVLLPGNEVIFSLETASDYVKDEKSCSYGFKCLVIGYEWNQNPGDGLRHLESELTYLGGMCAASLMKRDLVLPISAVEELDDDSDAAEEIAQQVYSKHSNLLSKGFALASPPTITQALDGVLPYSCHCNERLFLRDLVHCVPGTSGGRLSRWLQPESYVDPTNCQIMFNRDEMRCGWPTIVTVLTKDQYSNIVNVLNLKIEVKAVPIDKKEVGETDHGRKMRRVSQPDELTFGGQAQPCLDAPYEITVKDRMCYNAITIMKAYENYSFEELRYVSPAVKRISENMLVRPNGDGSYSATWTPASVGWYCVITTIDGYRMEETSKVQVREPPQGLTPPTQNYTPRKPSHQPNRLRKFVAKNSAGLRVRAHPSLQSEQIGIVHVNGTIAFIDEIHNDDGVWLRLNQDTIRQYCNSAYSEAWCLQYNQHLGKTLLLPLQEPKSILDHVIKETMQRTTPVQQPLEKGMTYKVVCCGASGHNVRSNPSLKAPPIGMLVLGNTITSMKQVINSEGTWLQLNKDTMNKYCFNWEGEAWTLAKDQTNSVYLLSQTQAVKEVVPKPIPSPGLDKTKPHEAFTAALNLQSPKKGFDFSGPEPVSHFSIFSNSPPSSSPNNSNPFVFGSSGSKGNLKNDLKQELVDCSTPQKWLKSEGGKFNEHKPSVSRDLPPELVGVSVKDLVKAIGESRANGNGVTPPDTPRRLSRSSSPHVFKQSDIGSRSSSPVPIPDVELH
uniref:PHR domain-containing protein n=1 Tax=Clastoptera arizonana TaxID=38151 RepID=A0A1B6EGK8_9HEMI